MKEELDVVAALIEKDAKVLLCQRKKGDYYENLWEFPGGAIEDRESGEKAIEREIEEELGIKVKANNLISEFHDENESLKIKVFLFACFIQKGFPQAKECQDFGFFTLFEVENLALAPVDKKIFSYLRSRE